MILTLASFIILPQMCTVWEANWEAEDRVGLDKKLICSFIHSLIRSTNTLSVSARHTSGMLYVVFPLCLTLFCERKLVMDRNSGKNM